MTGFLHLRPWLLFLVGGTALALVIHGGVPRREVLVVDGATLERTVKLEGDLRGTPLTDAERAGVLARLVDEEILFAEAQRRGHLRRGYVYSRLLKKMRFLFAEALTVPSDAELKAVYDATPQRFRWPGSIAFDHVFFSADSPAAPEDAAAFVRRLSSGEELRGDAPPLGRSVGLRTDADLARRLGPGFVEQLFAAPVETWTGPIASTAGVHYVRVSRRTDVATVPFEEVVEQLRGAWVVERQREVIARRTAGLVSSYEVYVEAEE